MERVTKNNNNVFSVKLFLLFFSSYIKQGFKKETNHNHERTITTKKRPSKKIDLKKIKK